MSERSEVKTCPCGASEWDDPFWIFSEIAMREGYCPRCGAPLGPGDAVGERADAEATDDPL